LGGIAFEQPEWMGRFMVILLTGGMGFIGSAVVRHLLATTDATV